MQGLASLLPPACPGGRPPTLRRPLAARIPPCAAPLFSAPIPTPSWGRQRRCSSLQAQAPLQAVAARDAPAVAGRGPAVGGGHALSEIQREVAEILQKAPREFPMGQFDRFPSRAYEEGEMVPIEEFPASARECVRVARTLSQKLKKLEQGMCPNCWLQQQHCMCSAIRPLPAFRHNLWIYTHHDEVLLASDTIKILLGAYPGRARIVVQGLPGATGEMLGALRSSRRALILYPDPNAVPADVIAQRWGAGGADVGAAAGAGEGAEAGAGGGGCEDAYDIVLLDGTWAQTRKLNKGLPKDLRRATLPVEAGAALAEPMHNIRKHPVKVRRVSTLEAFVALMEALGEPADGHRPLMGYLEKSMEAYSRQVPHAERISQPKGRGPLEPHE